MVVLRSFGDEAGALPLLIFFQGGSQFSFASHETTSMINFFSGNIACGSDRFLKIVECGLSKIFLLIFLMNVSYMPPIFWKQYISTVFEMEDVAKLTLTMQKGFIIQMKGTERCS
jgi:hypothetical protein